MGEWWVTKTDGRRRLRREDRTVHGRNREPDPRYPGRRGRQGTIDFTQHTESFYFQELDPKISLARQLPYALRLREAASATPDPAVQLSAQRLGEALEQLAQKIKTGFLRTGNDTEEILTAYAHEDGRTTP